ncbi:UDP-glucose flavonoid 3-O-glucosyltransferase 7-like isoform X2 [Corylus avellana]|uniref:UDP-glucose flavonoid 3-O-glucosyltransferase 7-like isoform X2 n=1 Tax=Corylus avellana TaxID=13451 RepID=UPI00286C9AD9|nr:UDP-glucose flavonoid 3-O-glucosyltransferase 7-like isoform X2 [Corylus avellana]
MGSENSQLHILFFPFMAPGHMIPMTNMAKLFAARGVKATIVTTPLNVPFVSRTIERIETHGSATAKVDIQTIKFPVEKAGLPEGCENSTSLTSHEMVKIFMKSLSMLQQPLELLLHDADCLVADMFFPWATDAAAKFEIKLTSMQLPSLFGEEVETDFTKMFKDAEEANMRSYGLVVNSFYELEPAYADHYRKVLGRKAWHIGPVSVCNKQEAQDKAQRGNESSVDEHECLKWLNAKKPNSVIYICFGSLINFDDSQLVEIAMGLKASGQQFIWVVKKEKNGSGGKEEWLPQGFEKRMEGKGLIIRGWAPQVLILDHEAVGGFVTHCGWNSTLEGVTAGVPMVTWPMFAEQFFNEKLVTQVLKIGVEVGAQRWIDVIAEVVENSINKEAMEKAVKRIMVGEEAEKMRSRAKALGDMARRAMEEEGSSYSDLSSLIEELKVWCPRDGTK